MKEFVRRNLPVLIIGLVTLVIFVLLIALAQKQPTAAPELIKVDEAQIVADHTFFAGSPTAPLTLIDYSNYNCPHCKNAFPVIISLVQSYPDQLRVGIRHLPFTQDPSSFDAAVAAQAAGRQGKFWEYSEILFANQNTFTKDNLFKYATDLGLNMEQFGKDYVDESIVQEVTVDRDFALTSGVQGTPTYFLNGTQVSINEVLTELSKYDNQTNTTQETFDASNFESVAISFDGSVFSPNDVIAKSGQKVVWTNTSTTAINLTQTINSYASFDVTIEPGQSYEMTLSHSKLWTYQETNSEASGQIFVE